MTEQQLYRWIIERFPGQAQRIESTTGSGIPDLYLCHQGVSNWVECKVMTNDQVLLRKEQYAWGMRHSKNGGRSHIVALCDCGCKNLHCWMFPDLGVRLCGKYLEVFTPPRFTVSTKYPDVFHIYLMSDTIISQCTVNN